MPRVWNVVLEMVGGVRPTLAQLERHDPQMARQVRLAVNAVAINVAHGMMAANENEGVESARYCSALVSAREAESSIGVAHALGYARVDRVLMAQLREITTTLGRMVERRRLG